VVPFGAFILLPKTAYVMSFWGALGVILTPFGSILVALGSPGRPRGTPCRQKWILGVFPPFAPPSSGPNFGTFPDKNIQKNG